MFSSAKFNSNQRAGYFCYNAVQAQIQPRSSGKIPQIMTKQPWFTHHPEAGKHPQGPMPYQPNT